MCPADIIVKPENIDGVIGPSSPTCGDNVGAVTEKRDMQRSSALPSPPPTPSKLRVKREDPDDILADLHCLFDGLNVDDSDDETDSGSDTAPPSPRGKGLELASTFGTKSCFYVGTAIHSFDDDHNVYLEDASGTSFRVHESKKSDSLLDMLDAFSIKDVMFQFGVGGDLYWNNQGAWCPVTTWQQPNLDLHPYDRGLGTDYNSSELNEIFQQSEPFDLSYDFTQFIQPSVTNGSYPDKTQSQPQTKKEMEEFLNPNPLNNSLQGSMPWSPSSSTQSPIVSSTSRATSESYEQPLISSTFKTERSLFQAKQSQMEMEMEQDMGWIAGVQLWKHETRQIQAARHAPIIDKMDRRRCPECNKVFRRPSSLEDHLNVHSGNKPHVCPYERCKTGFATKSNMKRHFTTHRAGTLEQYLKNGRVGKDKPLTATYNAKAFHTQRFRLT
ncbi:hypothetical protein BDV93DRAFT_523138 [Ceratobasidium sp. AG-I]|nr:hypothetical protein BDV93DRAFT_523138 [Ceratobasidium sp. AG-I]